ncbi:MAG: hypothetical protein A2X94_01200 [Bdellovibrionales bacterium GWB1_55_8]|nr:MAG: hypothetical protein A2X94_01200 [Bdellovibrionales bacterium GWB1_55_8]
MLLPPYLLHERIRVLRLFSGQNQAEMAQLLGMTQSWLSKLEAGIGELNASHLQLLRNYFNISADCILDGTIPYATIAKNAKASLRVPKKYLRGANSRIRMLYGFVSLYEEELGEEEVREFFRSINLPVEVLADPNLRVNLSLLFDFISYGVEKKVLTTEEAWGRIAKASITPLALGLSFSRLSQTKSPRERFEKFCELGRQYSAEFSYTVSDDSANSIQILADHDPSMRKPGKFAHADLLQVLGSYHKAMLEMIGQLEPMSGLAIEHASADNISEQGPLKFAYRARWVE